MQAGQTVGDDLCCLSAGLVGLFARSGQRLRKLIRNIRHNQNFFQPIQVRRGLNQNGGIRLMVRVRTNRLDRSHRQAAREDAIATAGNHRFAGLNALVR